MWYRMYHTHRARVEAICGDSHTSLGLLEDDSQFVRRRRITAIGDRHAARSGTAWNSEASGVEQKEGHYQRIQQKKLLSCTAHGCTWVPPACASSFNAFTLHKDEFKDIVQTSEYSCSATDHGYPWLRLLSRHSV